jgi:two-component system, cell cycle sensor histidine kinase and response regulator CckA
MKDQSGTNQELMQELSFLRQKLAQVEQSESRRKQTEEALQDSEARYRHLFEFINDAVLVHFIEEDGQPSHFVEVNDIACQRLGYTRKELLQLTPIDIAAPDKNSELTEIRKKLQSHGHVLLETVHLTKDGRRVPVESNIRLFNYNGQLAAMSISRDITIRKQMEEDLQRAHKLESLGVLAGGIAHDFNNLMMAVQGYMDLALLGLAPNNTAHKYLDSAQQCMAQAKELTSRLITFSMGGFPFRKSCDVTELVRDAVHRMIKGVDVKATFDFTEDLWPTEIDEQQMKQVFNNLTTNALEAMPQGGGLTVQAENTEIQGGNALPLKEGPYLRIIFADEGIGIPEEHLAKVFDPYFTTKGMGVQKGMGLGLSVCYSILKKHQGHILVDSQPGKGTTVTLYLPAQAGQATGADLKKTLSTDAVRVLIMDDELHIRDIERAYLEMLSYEVTDVKDGQEAIDAYKKALHLGTPFDLVILDLTVRQGLGGQLAMERLLKIDPEIRAIIASGYADDPVIEHYGDYGFRGALKKPFNGEEMKNLVENILQRKNTKGR